MDQQRQQYVNKLFTESLDRVLKGEDPDPAMAMTSALCRGEQVPEAEMEIILRAHENGPWAIANHEDLTVFVKWCAASGSPLQLGEPDVPEGMGLPLYRENFGDCCIAEAARGNTFAAWTRKGRLQIGFKHEADALKFRAADTRFSMEKTGNKRASLVVVEGGDNPKIMMAAVNALTVVYPTRVLPANGVDYQEVQLPGGDKINVSPRSGRGWLIRK